MRNSIYWCGALLGLATLSGAALADPHGGKGMHGDKMKPGMGHGMMMGGQRGGDDHFERIHSMRTLAMLDLNDDQRKKVMELRRELRKNTWDLKGQTIDQREQLGMLYGSDDLDVAAITSAYEKLFEMKLKMIEHTLKFKQDLRKVLTPEQQKKLRDMMTHGRMGGGMEMDAD